MFAFLFCPVTMEEMSSFLSGISPTAGAVVAVPSCSRFVCLQSSPFFFLINFYSSGSIATEYKNALLNLIFKKPPFSSLSVSSYVKLTQYNTSQGQSLLTDLTGKDTLSYFFALDS